MRVLLLGCLLVPVCLGGCTAGVAGADKFVDPSNGSGAPALLTALTKDASLDDCPNGGVVLSQGIDRNFNGRLDQDEIVEDVTLCHGRDGAEGGQGVEGAQGLSGSDGEACSVTDGGDGSFTLLCPGADPITLRNGDDGVDDDGCDSVCQSELLYAFDSHTFTTCGQTGRTGPSLGACRATYDAEVWSDDHLQMATQGVQQWTVPQSGTYRIEAWGAQGGVNHAGDVGGRGARMRGDLALDQGDVLHIVVGQQGVISPTGNSANGGSGGGGGSFVWTADGEPELLIAAGGGGGSGLRNHGGSNYVGRDGVTGTSGTPARDGQGPGGENGGDAANGGGRGWTTVQNDAQGGAKMNNYGGDGGFGGGGGGGYGLGGNRMHSAGGGGGYSGGGVCIQNYYAGGGGGSFNAGDAQSNADGNRSGHGQVTITQQ